MHYTAKLKLYCQLADSTGAFNFLRASIFTSTALCFSATLNTKLDVSTYFSLIGAKYSLMSITALQSSLFYASIRFKDINKKWQHCFLFPNI